MITTQVRILVEEEPDCCIKVIEASKYPHTGQFSNLGSVSISLNFRESVIP